MSLEIIGFVHSTERQRIKGSSGKTLECIFRKTGTEVAFCSSDGMLEGKYKTDEVLEDLELAEAFVKAKLKEMIKE